ncbi:MAG TPA: 2OG-Fe(II) oxygenase [Polyangiaceae bacterium]
MAADANDVAERVAALPWAELRRQLDARGFAHSSGLLSAAECRALSALYPDAARFRSKIIMERHGFGRGEYQYFGEPLPPLVQSLRESLYAELAPIASSWAEQLKSDQRFPETLAEFREQCRAQSQVRPTPLLLRYGPGDYNCLHQDLYGDIVFPLQVAVLLNEPGEEFTGGEFVLTEQRPRMQSRVHVVPLRRGDAVVFAVRERPVAGKRGFHRVNMRHGVSPLASGARLTLGVIFHDAL